MNKLTTTLIASILFFSQVGMADDNEIIGPAHSKSFIQKTDPSVLPKPMQERAQEEKNALPYRGYFQRDGGGEVKFRERVRERKNQANQTNDQ
ncbi:hypothetical protein [Candidatus Berkiella aquae]|uniref:Uncharacterized protein n=1 Tax=Candidatus Berkiella aquae TaxID=295108 RepID=A0A0Q9Y8Y1_9GAMM|nr:hypothetical protein [Candidatus Berkiella aquae]MCS5709921.1 hypothetical protein [Candidatus Berkiella aquae]